MTLPVNVDHGADQITPVIHEAAEALDALGVGVEVSPRLAGSRAVNTKTAARIHEGLLGTLRRVPDACGVFLWCEPSSSMAPLLSRASREIGMLTTLRALGTSAAATALSARQGKRDLIELSRELRARDASVAAAVPPPLARLDAPIHTNVLATALGCPDLDVDGAPLFGSAAAMCLAPVVKADRAHQHEALLLWAARHRDKHDAVCLGPAAGDGSYVAPSHLGEDVRAVRALGFTDVTIMGGADRLADDSGFDWLRVLRDQWSQPVAAAA